MRPEFHFTPTRGWINDPHGIVVHEGTCHAFFQYVPESLEWAPSCRWGHAAGPDLLSLVERPVAIAPGDGDDGIWSGSLVLADDGVPHIYYTAVSTPDFGIGRIREAQPTDGAWNRWQKRDIVAEAPPGIDLRAFRDPFVFANEGGWRMLVGAGTEDRTALVLSYSSDDLRTWRFDGTLVSRSAAISEPLWTGSLWECPQLIRFGGQDALVCSIWDDDTLHYVAYCVGSYAGVRFDGESWQRLSYGPSLYAPSFFIDRQGRRCLVFWMRGVADAAQGWVGAHSIAYVLDAREDRVVATPHPDLIAYRHESIAPGSSTPGRACDAIWQPLATGRLAIGADELTIAVAQVADGRLALRVDDGTWEMPYEGGPIRTIVDGPTLELSTTAGVMACAISQAGGRLVLDGDGDLRIWALSR